MREGVKRKIEELKRVEQNLTKCIAYNLKQRAEVRRKLVELVGADYGQQALPGIKPNKQDEDLFRP